MKHKIWNPYFNTRVYLDGLANYAQQSKYTFV